jgi:Protein of unknown function (DUF4056)
MKKLNILICSIFVFWVFPLFGKPPVLTERELSTPPPKVIRVCCTLGDNFSLFGVPFAKINQITTLEQIGAHQYLGNTEEGDGIIYTHRGGFIDMAHLRDQADWTAYLYALIRNRKTDETTEIDLGREGGEKKLSLKIAPGLDSLNELCLAGRIAYDLSIWHEISTWFGARTVPLISEQFSAFSVEDAYSNLLGVMLGIKAIESDMPYEEAMTQMISNTLDSLGVVKSEAENLEALEDVRDVWWTRDARLPSNRVTLERQMDVYPRIVPFIVPKFPENNKSLVILNVPECTDDGKSFDAMYQIKIRLNYRFPKIMKRNITQDDFGSMISEISREWNKSIANKGDSSKKGASIKKRKAHRSV